MLRNQFKPIVQEMLAAKVGDDESTSLVKMVPLSKQDRGERSGGSGVKKKACRGLVFGKQSRNVKRLW